LGKLYSNRCIKWAWAESFTNRKRTLPKCVNRKR
jgi:hypothetical protein